VQGPVVPRRQTVAPRGLAPIGALLAALALSACAAGMDIVGLGTDKTLQTGSIGRPGPGPGPSEIGSDQMTIRNAVTSANLAVLGGQPLAWANADTGSQGTILEVSESVADGTRCRRFLASRQSYEGVALYHGEACLGNGGIWAMREFAIRQ
jgi:hypothetical protein